MNVEQKLEFLEVQLDNQINRFGKKRKRDKKRAFGLKVAAVFLAAMITVLLGLKVGDAWATRFQNVALVFGALITLLTAIEAFYDHRSLWIRRTVTLARLYDLKRDLDFYKSGIDPTKISAEILAKYMESYDRILQDDLKAWLKLREDSTPRAGSQISPASQAGVQSSTSAVPGQDPQQRQEVL